MTKLTIDVLVSGCEEQTPYLDYGIFAAVNVRRPENVRMGNYSSVIELCPPSDDRPVGWPYKESMDLLDTRSLYTLPLIPQDELGADPHECATRTAEMVNSAVRSEVEEHFRDPEGVKAVNRPVYPRIAILDPYVHVTPPIDGLLVVAAGCRHALNSLVGLAFHVDQAVDD